MPWRHSSPRSFQGWHRRRRYITHLPYLFTTPSSYSKISSYHTIAPKYHARTITMSDSTFHTTTQDTRKAESKVAQSHHGNPPADSDVSKMKVSYLQSNITKYEVDLLHDLHSPSSTKIPTSPPKSKRPRPICLCLTNPQSLATSIPLTSVPLVLALDASSSLLITVAYARVQLQAAAPALMEMRCTRLLPHDIYDSLRV
jgi:hypothetical protein